MNDPDGGILIIDKQAGMTSAGVVSRIRRLLNMKRVGHTGTLDPFATGVLPICFGRATRASAYMLHWDKRYRVDIRLGYATTTMDIEGEAILPIADVGECRKWLEDESRIRQEVERLVEEKEQRPPMYSAIKHRGKPLYEYARQGIEIERPMRSIRVYESVFKNLWEDEQGYPIVSVELMVSAGTYIRSLADLLGQRLGCGAHAAALRRLSVGHFDLQKALTLDELESKIDTLDAHDWVIPVADVFTHWDQYPLTEEEAVRLSNGQSFSCECVDSPEVAFIHKGRLIAIGEISGGLCRTKRVFVSAESMRR